MMKKPYFLYIVLILILFPVYFVCISNSNLLDDGSNFILNGLSALADNHFYVENNFDHRARMSTLLLHFLPVNIAYFVFKIDSLKILVRTYSMALFLLPVLCCFWSILLFKRSNKLLLSIFPLLALSAGVYPVFAYGCVEAHLAIFIFFIFFQYYLLNFKFKKYDYIVFFLICILLYDLHESIIFFMPAIWITFFIYSDRQNKKILTFGLINSILAFILYFVFAYTPIGPNILSDNAVNSVFYPMHPPLIFANQTNNGESFLINFHLMYIILLGLNLVCSFFIKNTKILSGFNLLILLFIISTFPNHYIIYLFKLYRFVPIFILLIFMIIILVFYKKELLEKISIRLIPFLVTSLIISNIYILTYSKQYKEFTDKIVLSSKQGNFYFIDDIKNFENMRIFRENMFIHNNQIAQIAYSIIAINSKEQQKQTKGIIRGFNETRSARINKCNDKIDVTGGALNISIKNKFWDLSNFDNIYNETCE